MMTLTRLGANIKLCFEGGNVFSTAKNATDGAEMYVDHYDPIDQYHK